MLKLLTPAADVSLPPPFEIDPRMCVLRVLCDVREREFVAPISNRLVIVARDARTPS